MNENATDVQVQSPLEVETTPTSFSFPSRNELADVRMRDTAGMQHQVAFVAARTTWDLEIAAIPSRDL